MSGVNPALSLREREIEYMIEHCFARPSPQNFGVKSVSDAVKQFEVERVHRVLWPVELKAFCCEASVVGLRYVANPSLSVFRRYIWLLLLLAGAAFTTYQIQDRIRHYFRYPVNINIRVEHKDELRFPTVTICNENRISRNAADARGA